MGGASERSPESAPRVAAPAPTVEQAAPTSGSPAAAIRSAPDLGVVQRVIDGLSNPRPADRPSGAGPATKIRRVGDKNIVKGESAPMGPKDFKNAPSASDLEKWKPVWSNFPPGLTDDEAKLDELIRRFKANAVGFKYVGASRPFSLAGDCGSLVRTFKAIAEYQLGVDGVTVGYYNGSKAWYLPPGSREIDPARHPNVSNGGYLFGASHVWAVFGTVVYDVLFGQKGQKGGEVELYQNFPGPDGKLRKHYKVGAEWFRSDGATNHYDVVPDPTATGPAPAPAPTE